MKRYDQISRLGERFDVLVIGGGVNGLGIAWDAAQRGFSVLVVDKGDWGSGTSSWSSRMVHGGLKYLEKLEIGLVRESLRDREWLLHSAPHLVKPLPFAMPFYRRNAHHWSKLGAGMVLYDALSADKSLSTHRMFTRKATLKHLPGLSTDGLQGSALYFDAQVALAERLCVELALAANQAGAVTLNHMPAVRLTIENGRAVGAALRDELTGAEHEVSARFTINVTGPWVDDALTNAGLPHDRLIGGTKGTHLVVDHFPGAPTCAMYYEAVTDSRPLMVIPWLGRYLIGSTDKRFSGELDTAAADQEEIDYILRETNRLFPEAGLTESSILYAYTGVRPLPYVAEGKEGDITRAHILHDHRPAVDSLLSIVGGKLTTFRTLAEHAVDAVSERLGARTSSATRRLGLPGRPADAEWSTRFVEASDLGEAVSKRLARVYGARAARVASLIRQHPGGTRPLSGAPSVLAGEIVFCIREEQAVTLADMLARRTMLGLDGDLGRGVMREVAEVMAAELGWDERDIAREVDRYETYLKRFLEREAV